MSDRLWLCQVDCVPYNVVLFCTVYCEKLIENIVWFQICRINISRNHGLEVSNHVLLEGFYAYCNCTYWIMKLCNV